MHYNNIFPRLNLLLKFVPSRPRSDGNLFFQAGSKPLILDRGSLETAHTADKQTGLAESRRQHRFMPHCPSADRNIYKP